MAETLVDMAKYTRGLDEAQDILGRPPGADVTELQRARLKVCYERMMDGSARDGELWEIMTGQRDEELGIAAPSSGTRGARTKCKDCGAQFTAENRSGSDPARCRDCWSAKKRQYNQAYRAKS